ncbi:MAG: hypothetical protein OT477_01400 [Chloroflexi bacterium]|nr:hypothetical protein [Chloroflexota bacterium]
MLTRTELIAALQAALEPLPYVYALWEGGSAAFGRLDDYSDLDLQLVVDDEQADEAMQVITDTLAALSPITHRYDVPQPAWHGHTQSFFRLRDASEFLLVDCAVMKLSNPNRFLEREIHGQPLVYFDKTGVTAAPAWDGAAWEMRVARRRADLREMLPIFANFPEKELQRGQAIDALGYYNGLLVRSLVELLRLRHDPTRHHFGLRYLYHILPAQEVVRLEPLCFVADAADLRRKTAAVLAWCEELLGYQ